MNTDFAQAEVDNRIINLSKYEVNLPEKRGFFLESRNYLGYSFASGTQMFISRSIGRENNQVVPIVTGARITGKSRGWQMGFLEMQTKGISEAGIDPHNFLFSEQERMWTSMEVLSEGSSPIVSIQMPDKHPDKL